MKILFICTYNTCRSMIDEAVTNKIASPHIIAKSAGSSPRGQIHTLTLKYLTQHGYETSNLTSKSWDDLADYQPDIVITLCDQAAEETCPVNFKQILKVHWGLKDPSKTLQNENKNFDNTINMLELSINKLLKYDFGKMNKVELKNLFNAITPE